MEDICQNCGKIKVREVPNLNHEYKYCSQECRSESLKHRKIVVCLQCKKQFEVPVHESSKFCGIDCYRQYQKDHTVSEHVCLVCGRRFSHPWAKRRFCSQGCYFTYQKEMASKWSGGNKNYEIGRRFENYVKKKLQNSGFIVMRSFGSKGPWDLLAWRHDIGCLLVQCKYSKIHGTINEDGTIRQGEFITKGLNDLVVFAKDHRAVPVFAGVTETRRTKLIRLLSGEPIECDVQEN